MINKLSSLRDVTKVYLFLVFIPIFPLIFASFFQRLREEDFVFVFINACFFLFPLAFFNLKKYLSVIFPLLFIPSFLDLGHVFLYQGRISQSVFFVVFDSNPVESFEYLQSNLTLFFVSILALYTIICIYLFFKMCKFEKLHFNLSKKKFFLIWIALPLVFKFIFANFNLRKTFEPYIRSNQLFSVISSYISYKKEFARFTAFEGKIKHNFNLKLNHSFPKHQTHVLVIGESTTRNKMSLYSYIRDTNPNLKKIKDKLYIFNDVVASSPGTYGNLKRILTLANAENESSDRLSKNIVSIYKSAGFKTYWVSNQLVLGEHDTITSVFARQADKVTFTNTTNSTTYDEKVLPILERYLLEKVDKKFIVVHLFGTHMRYRNRYPEKFDKFKDSSGLNLMSFHNKDKIEYINQYDNAVLYNDQILSDIFHLISKNTSFATITYLSDHGEEVYDSKDLHGHPGENLTKNIYEIPFIIWLSDSYKNTTNLDLSKYLNRKYVSDDLEHTIFDLTGVYPDEYIKEKSLINESFIEKTRFADSI